MKKIIHKLWNMIKESKMESRVWIQLLALFLCVLFAVHLGEEAIVASSSYGSRELPIYSVDVQEKKIALSFDAAWGAEDFDQIMKVLDKHKVKTTFFMTGEWVKKYPDKFVEEIIGVKLHWYQKLLLHGRR